MDRFTLLAATHQCRLGLQSLAPFFDVTAAQLGQLIGGLEALGSDPHAQVARQGNGLQKYFRQDDGRPHIEINSFLKVGHYS